MNTPDSLDFKDFTRDYPALLNKSIVESNDLVGSILSCSEGARWTHAQGCANSSRQSTEGGVLAVAVDMVRTAPSTEWDEDMGAPLFGAHLRRAVRTIRIAIGR